MKGADSNGNRLLEAKYDITALFYDILDYPWERTYRKWRATLLSDVRGAVLEVGVGTGRNFAYYHPDVQLAGLELSERMLNQARKRARSAPCAIRLIQEDATSMRSIPDNHFDWVIATFTCCVIPNHLQAQTLEQFGRVLKPGGRFRLLEMVYSQHKKTRRRQHFFLPFVERVYGARWDRNTLHHLAQSERLKVTHTSFLKGDVYLLIEGIRRVNEVPPNDPLP
jgi:ubiquinone/menaquinone biosynthesis C-methylase UbiE